MNEARKQRMIREALGGDTQEISAGFTVARVALVLMVLVAASLGSHIEQPREMIAAQQVTGE